MTKLDGYVWCEVRGDVHSDIPPLVTPRHNEITFWDLFQDGELCCPDTDHRPVFVEGEI